MDVHDVHTHVSGVMVSDRDLHTCDDYHVTILRMKPHVLPVVIA